MASKKKTTKRSSAGKKTSTRKKSTQKAATSKSTKKKVTKKKVTRKKVASTEGVKTTTKKKTSKTAPAKKKKSGGAKSAKKTITKKAPTKKAGTKKPAAKKAPTKKPTASKPASKGRSKVPGPEVPLEDALEHEWTHAELKKVKTGLTRKDLQYFLNLLLEKRAEIVGNIQGMELTRSAALSDIAHMPLHMADVGSDNFDQEFTLGLMEFERKILKDINEALIRMKEGIYGVCLDSGRPISRERLEAKPWAKYCIEAARFHEKRGW